VIEVSLETNTTSVGLRPPAPGGGGGGGVDILPLAYIPVNLTTGFTKLAPDALDFTPSFASGTGVTTFAMGTLSPGNAKYSMAGTGQEWPRSYKALVDSAGTTMTTADSFTMNVRLSQFDAVVPSSADLRFGIGMSLDPTATTTADFDGYAVLMRTNSSSRRAGVAKFDATSSSLFSTTANGNTFIYGQIIRSSRKLPVVLSYGETSGQMPNNSYVDSTSNVELAATTDWNLWVGVATFANTGTVASSQSFSVKVEYQIIRTR
jgi:hypothetical protein